MARRVGWTVATILLGLLVVAQVLPIGSPRTNPPVLAEPVWDSPATRDLAARTCFDCHSNETAWPWYSAVAPLRWFVVGHTMDGREALNVSEWGGAREQADGSEAAEAIREGEMPMRSYVLLHADARLTAGEREALAAGLLRSLGRESSRDASSTGVDASVGLGAGPGLGEARSPAH